MASFKCRLSKSQITSLIYHDIFDYPMTEDDLKKWEVGRQVIRKRLSGNSYQEKNGYFFIKGRQKIIEKRLERERHSSYKLGLLYSYKKYLKKIPWVKFVGITGSLTMNNSDKNSDIDLMIITLKNTLWVARGITLTLLKLMNVPLRKYGSKEQNNRLCLNIWLDESDLVWPKNERNIYTAHEILQIIPFINKGKIFEKFLRKNKWVLEFWKNRIQDKKIYKYEDIKKKNRLISQYLYIPISKIFNFVAFVSQYLYMRNKITNEVITSTRAIFHPRIMGQEIIERLQKDYLLE